MNTVRIPRIAIFSLFLLVGLPCVGQAAPWWNPFVKDAPSKNPHYVPGKMMVNGKPINGSSVEAPKSMGATAVDKVGSGTKHVFTSTKNLLTFKKKTPPQQPGWSRMPPGQKKPAPQKSGGVGSWFRPKPQPEGPTTVEEFLKAPRP